MKDFEIDTISLSTGRLSTVYLWGGLNMQPLCNMQSQPHCCSWNTFLVYWFLLLGANVPFSVFFFVLFFHFTFFVSLISSVMSIYIDSLYVGFKGLINVRIRRLELFKVQTITSKHLCCFNGVHNYLKKNTLLGLGTTSWQDNSWPWTWFTWVSVTIPCFAIKPGQFYTVMQNFKLKAIKAAEVSTASISPTLCILAFYIYIIY